MMTTKGSEGQIQDSSSRGKDRTTAPFDPRRTGLDETQARQKTINVNRLPVVLLCQPEDGHAAARITAISA